MKNTISNFNHKSEDNDAFDLTNEIFKYLYFWKYFLLSLLISLFFAFIINRYSPLVFDTNAKIQILDKNLRAETPRHRH